MKILPFVTIGIVCLSGCQALTKENQKELVQQQINDIREAANEGKIDVDEAQNRITALEELYEEIDLGGSGFDFDLQRVIELGVTGVLTYFGVNVRRDMRRKARKENV